MVRNSKGICIFPDDCPCSFGDREYEQGSVTSVGCNEWYVIKNSQCINFRYLEMDSLLLFFLGMRKSCLGLFERISGKPKLAKGSIFYYFFFCKKKALWVALHTMDIRQYNEDTCNI